MAGQAVQNVCPGCGKWLLADAVRCIQCGFDKRLGRRPGTITSLGRALRLPRVSGVQSFVVLLLCMGLTALLVPMALNLPVWVEAEIVLGAWWVIWSTALALFLYNGWLVSHDFRQPHFSSLTPAQKDAGATPSQKDAGNDGYHRGWWDGYFTRSLLDIRGDDAIGGCLELIVLIILLPFIVVFVIEAAVFIVFVMYLLIRGMLAQVANSRLRCRGRPGRSLGFGVLWATVYTAPLAGFVWFVHRLHG
jgi:hypothetical protein